MFALLPIRNISLSFILDEAAKAGPALSGLLLQMDQNQILRIAGFVIVLVILWIVFRTIFHLTMRLFAFGCGAILVLGLVLVLMRIFTQ